MPKITIKNTFKHLGKILKHKYWVFYYCCKAGIPWRGIKHDMSKFSPTEFWESVRYYQGNRSPIDACKEDKGVSKAWMHHKGRNSHHYEYWIDNFDNGGKALIMPFEDVLEMLCDYLGAGRAYMGKQFSYRAEYHWWVEKQKKPLKMHPVVEWFITTVLSDMWELESRNYEAELQLDYDELEYRYNEFINCYKKEGHL